jgi:hypothetical protein
MSGPQCRNVSGPQTGVIRRHRHNAARGFMFVKLLISTAHPAQAYVTGPRHTSPCSGYKSSAHNVAWLNELGGVDDYIVVV